MDENEKNAVPVSEVSANEPNVQIEENKEISRQVPLEALEAERRKRQEAEAKYKVYEELARRSEEKTATSKEDETFEDDEDYVNKGELRKFQQSLKQQDLQAIKREISEETFKEMNPGAIKAINNHLKEILERKPWLAESIERAPNRYARAYEIVQDYTPQVNAKQSYASEAKKIVENAQKPGSPATVGKSQQLSGADYLKKIAGTKEFQTYRKQLLGR